MNVSNNQSVSHFKCLIWTGSEWVTEWGSMISTLISLFGLVLNVIPNKTLWTPFRSLLNKLVGMSLGPCSDASFSTCFLYKLDRILVYIIKAWSQSPYFYNLFCLISKVLIGLDKIVPQIQWSPKVYSRIVLFRVT